MKKFFVYLWDTIIVFTKFIFFLIMIKFIFLRWIHKMGQQFLDLFIINPREDQQLYFKGCNPK